MKQVVFEDMLKKVSKSACTSSVVEPTEPYLLLHQLFPTMKSPQNTEEDCDDTESAYEGGIAIKYSSK